ncbi:hypothetical protein LC040_02460 [Bacillus tianshenii]|nr:hypothetical protein LC040_02460 [Bacillus tianshenii]
MRTIRTRKDIEALLLQFETVAEYDSEKGKWYFVFRDLERNGEWTLMKREKQWTLHGKGETYCDLYEVEMEREKVCRFLWKSRKAVNEELRQRVLVEQ